MHPSINDRLRANALIFEQPNVEEDIVKIQKKKKNSEIQKY